MPPAISAAVDLPMPTTTEAEGQRRPELSFAKVSTSGHRKWMDVMLDGEVVGRVDRIGAAAGELWQPNQGTRERLGGSVPAGAASPEAIKAMMRRSHKRAPYQAASPPEPPAISSAIDMPMGKGADVLAPPAPPPKRERKARPAPPAPPPVAPPSDAPAPPAPPVDAPAMAMDDDGLYQGHRGRGVGQLAKEIPERRDGDKDTVAAERRPRKGDAHPISPEPVPQALWSRVLEDLGRQQMTTFAKVKYTPAEKKEMKSLFTGERSAVKSGEDRQTFSAARDRITEEARKRGKRTSSQGAQAVAATTRAPTVRKPSSGRNRNPNKDLKKSPQGLPGVVVRPH